MLSPLWLSPTGSGPGPDDGTPSGVRSARLTARARRAPSERNPGHAQQPTGHRRRAREAPRAGAALRSRDRVPSMRFRALPEASGDRAAATAGAGGAIGIVEKRSPGSSVFSGQSDRPSPSESAGRAARCGRSRQTRVWRRAGASVRNGRDPHSCWRGTWEPDEASGGPKRRGTLRAREGQLPPGRRHEWGRCRLDGSPAVVLPEGEAGEMVAGVSRMRVGAARAR
jgi:hypothetical protein